MSGRQAGSCAATARELFLRNMATITINILDSEEVRVNNALAKYFEYQAGPETKKQFVRRKMAEKVKELVMQSELQDALATTRTTTVASVTALTIT